MNRSLLPRWFCLLTKQCLQTDATKYSVSIGFGIVFGIILNISHADHDFTSLITLPGQLFLRALQCAVVPMMSVSHPNHRLKPFIFSSPSSLQGSLISPHRLHRFIAKDGLAHLEVKFSSII
jgi:hypothetical protein